MSGLRIGIDVGGTFTKAVAVQPDAVELVATASVPTTHDAAAGVTEGVVAALEALLSDLGPGRERIDLVAFSTTQAMNALLEGDVSRVGVIGVGQAPDLRKARKRTRIRSVDLAPGRALETEHEFIDATTGIDDPAVDAAVRRLSESGCRAIAVSAAFAVESSELEEHVADRALAAGLPVCTGHSLSGAYGLETRTVSAAVNAAVLPIIERTARLVELALDRAGLDVPLLVLRGDGGAMGTAAFRRSPALTIGSGPAAGVAAALHREQITDAIVIECGGTSTNVSVVKGGRPVLRTIKVMGRPTALRSIDSWVVGAAGGSMPLVGKLGRIAAVGPRSAHLAGLPYACFSDPAELADATLELIAPERGDPERYAVLGAGGRRYAVTATCAANALGRVKPGSHAEGAPEAARLAFEAMARSLHGSAEQLAEAVLERATSEIAKAVGDAVRTHGLDGDLTLVALGGSAGALAGPVAERVGARTVFPADGAVLSSIGTALSLVRAEATKGLVGAESGSERTALARQAERECVRNGAEPSSVSVELSYDADQRVIRAVATGAAALESGAPIRPAVDERARRAAASRALSIPAERLHVLCPGAYYTVYSENGSGGVAAVDGCGGIALAERSRAAFRGEGDAFVEQLRSELAGASLNLGIATMLPRVSLVCGSRVLDLSDATRTEEIVEAARRLVAERAEPAVAVIAR